MKKLQRKHARMVIGFMACAIVAALVSIVMMEILPQRRGSGPLESYARKTGQVLHLQV